MNQIDWLRGGFLIFFLGSFLGLSSCTDTLESSQVIYDNDFSTTDLNGFENGRLFVFQNDTIVGYYHNEEVALNLQALPSHNMLKITTEILVHDTWDGNQENGVSGPDIWLMGIENTEIYRTTFSNTPCESTYCLHQSFPNDYFRQNIPKSGAIQTNLPGLCSFGAFPNFTTRYSISKIIEHSNSTVRIFWNTELMAEGVADPACDESWSLSRVTVEALNVK